MHVIIIIIVSILLQFAAAFLALRLIWITNKTFAWVIIALAISLMALRRCITLYAFLFYVTPTSLDQTTEVVALVVSALIVVGIAWLVPVFHSIIRSEGELRHQMIQTCMDGIIFNDMQGNILIFNDTAVRILGYSPEEVLGKINVRELYPPGIAQEIKLKIEKPDWGGKGILENYETMARHKNGTLIPVWLTARIISEDGRASGIVGHFRDLRERKRLEE
jgi:PAS domain S-box-containing protein